MEEFGAKTTTGKALHDSHRRLYDVILDNVQYLLQTSLLNNNLTFELFFFIFQWFQNSFPSLIIVKCLEDITWFLFGGGHGS